MKKTREEIFETMQRVFAKKKANRDKYVEKDPRQKDGEKRAKRKAKNEED